MADLTPEQKRTVLYEGGLRETVTLAGHKIVLGELALKDKYKIFECMEDDLAQVEKTWREYIGVAKPGILRKISRWFAIIIFHEICGIEEKHNHAINTMKEYIEGLTTNDIKLIQICTEGHNNLTPDQIKDIVLSAPSSEVQVAIQKALEIHGIDTKKYLAARQTAIPTDAAKTMISTAGSAE